MSITRRGFIAALPFIPSAAKAAVRAAAVPPPRPTTSIITLLNATTRHLDHPAPLDLDWIFEQLYAIKKRREAEYPVAPEFIEFRIPSVAEERRMAARCRLSYLRTQRPLPLP